MLKSAMFSNFIESEPFARPSACEPLYFDFFLDPPSLWLSTSSEKESEKLFERKLIADEKVEMDGDRIGTNFTFFVAFLSLPFSSLPSWN